MKLGVFSKFFFLFAQDKWERKNSKKVKEVWKIESKEEYFIKNGGILLEKQIALSQGKDIGAGQLKILSEDEIQKATNSYDPDLIFRSYQNPSKPDSNHELVNNFLTDVAMKTVLCHDNMIKLYGCCLETCVPIMVHEFYPSKALYEHLHGDMSVQKPLTWTSRLRAATYIAYALSYMHNALSRPVVHRDIMSYGILLDSSFHAKLSFFGHSVAITPEKKDHRWPVHGTPGYIDPEYIETQEVTEKCDAYSFGVLIELLTSRDPFEMTRCGNDLVDEFVSVVEKSGFKAIVDTILMEESNIDEIQGFIRLALKCVAKRGRNGLVWLVLLKSFG